MMTRLIVFMIFPLVIITPWFWSTDEKKEGGR